jgi:hypothetical protein
MKITTFTKTKLATSLSLVLGVSSMLPAYAADEASEENIEVLQVTGIRGSLIKSMDIKRSSQGVVDAISAEDMGKFPDTNLAESLQRSYVKWTSNAVVQLRSNHNKQLTFI